MKGPARSSELLFRRARPDEGPAIRELVLSILRDNNLPTDSETDADLEDIYGQYFARGGSFRVLTTMDGTIVGSVGLKPVDSQTVELRKMYLQPAYRGQRHGKRMLDWALTRARELGFKRITLETASVLKEATALYTSHGFRVYEGEKHASRCDVTMEIDL